VTESVALDAPTGSAGRLRELRGHGVRVAIDDFGTGYSSLAYLRNLPVDTLKIDRTFIEGVGDDAEATAVAKAIISLAGTLHLQSVAEGIETTEQASALRALGCDLAQGYLFGRPMPASELGVRLAQQEAAVRAASPLR
jgi:sensor c-di-GMP phosphodiesterase-like protein